jgi:hypothetical protein
VISGPLEIPFAFCGLRRAWAPLARATRLRDKTEQVAVPKLLFVSSCFETATGLAGIPALVLILRLEQSRNWASKCSSVNRHLVPSHGQNLQRTLDNRNRSSSVIFKVKRNHHGIGNLTSCPFSTNRLLVLIGLLFCVQIKAFLSATGLEPDVMPTRRIFERAGGHSRPSLTAIPSTSLFLRNVQPLATRKFFFGLVCVCI